jgi:BirA family biotin operon repressor/biotin-[acetyl-CoA-carboxylase] ligase
MLPGNWRLLKHDVLPSTADLVRRLADAGEPEGLAVMAGRQTGGRGQQGRAWSSPVGNLYLSLLLRPAEPLRLLPQWALLAAVAVAEALAPFVPTPRGGEGGAALTLKWPNDLLLGGAKLAGILTEGAAGADGEIDWLAFGIGVNLAVAPALPDRPTASLAGALAPAEAAVRVIAALERWRRLRRREGFAPVREAWLARGPALGAPMILRQPQLQPLGQVEGVFEGLAEDGRLLLRSDGETRAYLTGEIAA